MKAGGVIFLLFDIFNWLKLLYGAKFTYSNLYVITCNYMSLHVSHVNVHLTLKNHIFVRWGMKMMEIWQFFPY